MAINRFILNEEVMTVTVPKQVHYDFRCGCGVTRVNYSYWPAEKFIVIPNFCLKCGKAVEARKADGD